MRLSTLFDRLSSCMRIIIIPSILLLPLAHNQPAKKFPLASKFSPQSTLTGTSSSSSTQTQSPYQSLSPYQLPTTIRSSTDFFPILSPTQSTINATASPSPSPSSSTSPSTSTRNSKRPIMFWFTVAAIVFAVLFVGIGVPCILWRIFQARHRKVLQRDERANSRDHYSSAPLTPSTMSPRSAMVSPARQESLPIPVALHDKPKRRLTTSLRNSLLRSFRDRDGKQEDAQRPLNNEPTDNGQRNSKRNSYFWPQQSLPGFLQFPLRVYAPNLSKCTDSEGCRSVSSIQWIGFNRSMEGHEQGPSRKSGLFITNDSKRSSRTTSLRSSRRNSAVMGAAGGGEGSRVDTQEEEMWHVKDYGVDDEIKKYRESIDSESAVRTATLIKSTFPVTSSLSREVMIAKHPLDPPEPSVVVVDHGIVRYSGKGASEDDDDDGDGGDDDGSGDDGGLRDETPQRRPSFQNEERGAELRKNSLRAYVEERKRMEPGWPRPVDENEGENDSEMSSSPTFYDTMESPALPGSPINVRFSAIGRDLGQGDVWTNVLEALESEEYSRERRSD